MIYREFDGKKLSMLGLGTMRLPLTEGGSESDIDEEHVQRMVDHAMEHGVNYLTLHMAITMASQRSWLEKRLRSTQEKAFM